MPTVLVLVPSGLILDGIINMSRADQNGFTLIELLIYVAIFATMIGAVVGLALSATAERVNSQIAADLNYQGEAAIALITQTVRQASAINSPTTGDSATTLSLSMANSTVNPTVFDAAADANTTRLRMSEGAPAIVSSLSNGHVRVVNLSFTNMSLNATKGSVLIKLTLKYQSASDRRELQYSKTFYGAATIP